MKSLSSVLLVILVGNFHQNVAFNLEEESQSKRDVAESLVSFEEEGLERLLQADLESEDNEQKDGKTFAQRCGNRNPCQGDLVCTDMDRGFRRCLPDPACLQTKTQAAGLASFDLKAQITNKAGLLDDETFIETWGELGNRKAFVQSDPFQALVNSTRDIFMSSVGQQYSAILRECAGLQYPYPDKEVAGKQLTLEYYGIHVEGGAIVDGAFDFLFGSGMSSVQTNQTAIRICAGFPSFGAGAEISFLLGINEQFHNCGAWIADIDAGLGLNIGANSGVNFNGRGLLEFTFGLGAGLEIAGSSFCGTFTL